MSKKEIIALYRRWRELHGNKKPDRVVVKMYWEDEGKDEKRISIQEILHKSTSKQPLEKKHHERSHEDVL